MIILKVQKSLTFVGLMPLYQALVVDGGIYYLVLVLTFSLNIVATMNDEVSGSDPFYLMR